MAWNTGKSILGTGDEESDVRMESDTIFTAVFVGLTRWKAERSPHLWRVAMEPSTERGTTRAARTADDRRHMEALNDVCSKVNHLVRADRDEDVGGVSWRPAPRFQKGAMSVGGDFAKDYEALDPQLMAGAWTVLTDAKRLPKEGQRYQSMYIGRDALCGLVVAELERHPIDGGGKGDAAAICAMSTIRTTLGERTVGVGDRWRPPADAEVRRGKDEGYTWGMITSAQLQETMKEQGMRFHGPIPPDPGWWPNWTRNIAKWLGRKPPIRPLPDPARHIVGYTHGIVRAIYECTRIGTGIPCEMPLGGETFTQASCMACSAFAIANGRDPSSSHLGRSESWVPYYTAESHNTSYLPDEVTIEEAVRICNARWATHVHEWMTRGVAAMLKSPAWVDRGHAKALAALETRLNEHARADGAVASGLWLDALTYHENDAHRVNRTLVYGDDPRPSCSDTHDWSNGSGHERPEQAPWKVYVNPYTDHDSEALHAL